MKTKKMISLLSAAALLLLLAACGQPAETGGSAEPAESEEISVSEPAQDESAPVATGTVSAEELIGTWKILGWTVDADGSWAPLDAAQYYSFDGSSMEYDTGADVMTSAYTVEDGANLNLTDWELTWPMSLNDEGQLCLGDGRYGITYVCEKVTDDGSDGTGTPSVSAGETALTEETLIGKWTVLGWIVDADGSWAPLEAPQYYSFDGTTLEYDAGDGALYTSAYTFADGKIDLSDWEVTWPSILNENGQLCIQDGRYGITYVCEK